MCLCVLVYVNFGDEILLGGGGNVKPGKNSTFLNRGKTVILTEIGNFLDLG